MWGAIIGAGVTAASSIIGGMQAAKAAREQREQLQYQQSLIHQKEAENRNWYNRRMNEDYTQTAESVNAMRQAREAAREQINSERAVQAVQGGIGEVGKDAANKLISNTAADIAARGTAQKNAIEGQYLQQDNHLTGQEMTVSDKMANMYSQRAQAAAQAGSAGAQAGMGMVQSSVKNMFKA